MLPSIMSVLVVPCYQTITIMYNDDATSTPWLIHNWCVCLRCCGFCEANHCATYHPCRKKCSNVWSQLYRAMLFWICLSTILTRSFLYVCLMFSVLGVARARWHLSCALCMRAGVPRWRRLLRRSGVRLLQGLLRTTTAQSVTICALLCFPVSLGHTHG